jgi:serine/threonine protein kinase
MLTPGLVLSDRYRLSRCIAVGGMGEVWAADDIRLARSVAVKILRPELTGDPEFVDRFRTEARITAALNHPGIAAVYDYGEVGAGGDPRGHTAYLVMELIAGESLSAVLARMGRLSTVRTLDVLDQTGRALQVAHARSLVHRDIKPGNLLITPGGQVKITDFGIAKLAHQAPVTRTGLVMGTAQYISPEQATGHPAVPASDIYSLGVVAYECLAGRLPFPGENAVAMAMSHVRDTPGPLPADVPPPVAALVMHMLAKDPTARFPNGAALAQAVGQLRSGAFPSASTSTGPHHIRPAASTAGHPARPTASFPAPALVPAAGAAAPRTAPPTRRAPVPAAALPPNQQPARPAPRPAARPPAVQTRQPSPPRPTSQRTGLSVAVALLVLALAGALAVWINQSVGDLPAPVAPAGLVVDPAAGSGNGALSGWSS